jgi:HD superfamily phosphohydrolase
MPYPNFLVGERLHKSSGLVILDKEDANKRQEEPATPISRGATGIVWRVMQEDVIERAVKILSPEEPLLKKGDWKYFVGVFEKEMRKLASLTHHNLAKLIAFGRIPPEEVPHVNTEDVGIPYIVMEFIKGSPLHTFIAKADPTISVEVVLDLFDDILSAMMYLHRQQAMHSDIKEGNILVRLTDRWEAVLVDMGAAHIFSNSDQDKTIYITTPTRVSKEWQDRVGKYLQPEDLKKNRVILDLYMFGAMLKLFLNGDLPESSFRPHPDWRPSVLSSLKRIFANLGIVTLSRVADKCLEKVYLSADEVRQELSTCRDRLVSPLGIAELSLGTDTKTSLVLPDDLVPFTKRMTWILNHPSVQRLRNISQLDFVSMIYLGATHNRLLHSVQTYNLARRYIGTLLRDPIFRAHCAERCKLEAALLAGLLHDLGHYPLGHVFEDFAFRGERDGPFANIPRDEKVTSAILYSPKEGDEWIRDASNQHIDECRRVLRDDIISSLPDLIREKFNERVLSFLRRILSDQEDEDKAILILRSIVNGPLDVDKICYLRTDSRYTGASYGSAVDVDGILASLTCTVDNKPGIAITEKGICAAESIATGRRWMYQRVYWHKTNRAMMAMLRFVPQYLFEQNLLTFSEYFNATYAMSDIEAVKWMDEEFEKKRLDKNLENPAQMILNGRRGIYKSLLEFSPTDTEAEDVKIREYLMVLPCAGWSKLSNEIAKIAKKYVNETKLSDVLIDIPSKRRHEIGDPIVIRPEKSPRKLSELSPEFRETKKFFEAGALSCRIFIHPVLRKSLIKANKLTMFKREAYSFLKDLSPR